MDFQSRNLTIPRGKLLFAKFLDGTQTPGPFREFGNCPEFTLTRESETLSHYSAQSGLRVLDEEIAIQSTLAGSMTTDDIKSENVAYFFTGDVDTITSTSQTGVTVTYTSVKAGDVFQLGMSDSNPSGHRLVASVVCTDGAVSSPVTYDLNDDYTLDADLGIISIPTGSAAIGENLKVTYNVTASTREQIVAGENQVEGALKFISYNPVGAQGDIIIPRARLSPNGDFALVMDPESTEFQTMPLNISVLKKGNLALAYRDGRAVA